MTILKRMINRFELCFFYIYNYYLSLRGLPGMTSKEIELFLNLFDSYKNRKLRILEWGSGRSTVYYAKYLKASGFDFEWYAIDNSKEWYEKVLKQLKKFNLTDRVHLYLFEFKPFWFKPNWDWDNSRPQDFDPKEKNEVEYISFPATLGVKYDVIIVDGRFRRRCLLEAQKMLDPHGFVILHDAQKKWYHSSLSAYKCGKFIDSGYLYDGTGRTLSKLWVGSNDNNNLSIVDKFLQTKI